MKIILFLLAVIFSASVFGQLNQTIFDEGKNQEILIGECNVDGFTQGEFASWYTMKYENYEVEDIHFNPNYTTKFDSIYVFLGSWCSDTQRELPRFCKIMDHKYFQGTYVRYFAFDGKKQNDIIDNEEYYVQFLPTFVFYYNGNELCRIIETPRDSLEEDIMDLLDRIQGITKN